MAHAVFAKLDIFTRCLLLFVACASLHVSRAENWKGSLPLNSGTFDKIVPNFKAVLVKFDRHFSRGDKEDEFKKVAEASVDQPDLIVAEVPIQVYGERLNSDLGKRYKIQEADYPEYRLFLEGKSEPIAYTGDEAQADDIMKFVIKETGLWLGLPACMEEFDSLVKQFIRASGDERKKFIKEAETIKGFITDPAKKERAAVYVKTMQKVLEMVSDI